jgi:hypothetical protein
MKKCSLSLAMKEMQIKTTLRFHLTHVRIATIKNTTNNKCCQGCKWMELENIILSKVSLAQKNKNSMFSLICGH